MRSQVITALVRGVGCLVVIAALRAASGDSFAAALGRTWMEAVVFTVIWLVMDVAFDRWRARRARSEAA